MDSLLVWGRVCTPDFFAVLPLYYAIYSISGLYRDDEKDNGSHYSRLGLCRDNGKGRVRVRLERLP